MSFQRPFAPPTLVTAAVSVLAVLLCVVLALRRRAEWRGIDVELSELTVGDELDSDGVDLIFFGGGQDREQAVVSPDFLRQKAAAVRDAVEDGAALLSVCGGYQLLGEYYVTADGTRLPGLGLVNLHTVPGRRRNIGNILIDTSGLGLAPPTLVVFELMNVAWKRARRQPKAASLFLEALEMLDGLGLRFRGIDQEEVVRLGLATGLTAYDATYLWLSRALRMPLVTLDRKLAAHAPEV